MNSNPPQSNEVPTPETDAVRLFIAAGDWCKESDCTDCALSHAENLERKLAEAQERANKWAGTAGSFAADVELLNQQLSTLTKPIEPEELRVVMERLERSIAFALEPRESDIQALILAVRQGQSINQNRYLQSLNINQNFPKE